MNLLLRAGVVLLDAVLFLVSRGTAAGSRLTFALQHGKAALVDRLELYRHNKAIHG